MQDKMYKTGNNAGTVSDAELDALLAEWAEGEMEPPAGFHEQTMARLRAEAQPQKITDIKAEKKKNNIVTLFAKNKRWTSIAAAAVLMLFCVPVVNGQLGGDATESIPGAVQQQQLQVAQDNSRARTMDNSQENDAAVDNIDVDNIDVEKSAADVSENKKEAVMSSAIGSEANADNENIAVQYMLGTEDPANVPMVASLDGEDGIKDNARVIDFNDTANGTSDDEKTLEELEQELKELQEQLAQYQAQLDEKPDDANLQLIISEQQKAIDDVKEKIEALKSVELKNVEAKKVETES